MSTGESPVAMIYTAAILLANMGNCLHSYTISQHFRCSNHLWNIMLAIMTNKNVLLITVAKKSEAQPQWSLGGEDAK